jgi:RNA polymerase sigma-70 factor (sigma-E family)
VGDREQFGAFVHARSAALLRTGYLLTRDWGLAEDLLQTALAKARLAWGRIHGDPDPYVRRILVTTATSGWRRRWRGELPTAALPETPTASTAVQDMAERDEMWQALGRLTARQRAVVVLRYYEDLTEQQTAQVLGCSLGTVKSQTSKALARLRVDPTLTADRAEERC